MNCSDKDATAFKMIFVDGVFNVYVDAESWKRMSK